ncbi:MAG: S8 family peptidase [Candidatus Nanoarchaeia archaeon]
MNKKLVLVCLFSLILVSSVFAASDNIKLKRIIADSSSKTTIQNFESKGCTLIWKMKSASSFYCPETASLTGLKWREDRIFYLVDLNSDKQINADDVWSQGITGSGANVIILDSGVDINHPELKDSYLGGYDFVNKDNDPFDDNGHGTHVAGIITANGNDGNAKGVAPDAGFYMLKVCNSAGSCYESDMIAAMEYAVNNNLGEVMSISIGGGNYNSDCDSDTLASKVNWVVDNGITVIVAAGNNGMGVSSPACASKAIAVGAVDSSNNVVWWSNRGTSLDIVAPGVNIYSTLKDGKYGKMSGTSMSTPHVSGVAALLLQAKPDITKEQLRTALLNNTNPVNKCYKCSFSYGGACYSQSAVTCTSSITGKGVVDALKAYNYVMSLAPACNDGDTRSCGTDVGVCEFGTQTCAGGNWGPCTGGVDPSTETCNGLDDDCDGSTDEGLGQTTCGVGICQNTVDNCVNGEIQTCTPKQGQATETCGNGLDDDCDGIVDNGCQITEEKFSFTGTLNKQGQEVKHKVIVNENAKNLEAKLTWTGYNDLTLRFYAPSGNKVKEVDTSTYMNKTEQGSISNPIAGEWYISAYAKRVMYGSSSYTLSGKVSY